VSTTFLVDLLAELRQRDMALPEFRYFGCAGAPIPARVVVEAEAVGVTVLRGYGSTETLGVAQSHPDFSRDLRIETEGRAFPGVDIELRDPAGAPVEPGVTGEVFIRSPSTCLGFARDPERTAATIDSDGWVRTGDLAAFDRSGHITIAGRQKDIIIRGGMNISPKEVEDVLGTHPSIQEVAIVGLLDDRLGEIACACVVPVHDEDVDLGTLTAFLLDRGLAKYKLPERCEVFRELPRTDTGKVQRRVLSVEVDQRTIAPGA
jgi:acyl-coenzyme A synthetase/AMP-(fatty) acid ligase